MQRVTGAGDHAGAIVAAVFEPPQSFDDQIGRLMKAFDPDRTLFVVVGDHGEGLGDHDELAHGLFVYDATMRVPWLIAGPGVQPGVVAEPVSLVDVSPTLLHSLGLPIPGREKSMREVGHQIADEIYEKILGVRGAFWTRVAYVTATGLGPGTRYMLKVADSDGMNEQVIVRSPEPLLSPAWSPAGAKSRAGW